MLHDQIIEDIDREILEALRKELAEFEMIQEVHADLVEFMTEPCPITRAPRSDCG